jgi:hypothetical protein
MSITASRVSAALGLAVASTVALGGISPAAASTSTSVSGGDQVSAAATKYRTLVKVKAGKRSVRFSACATVDAYATYVVRYKAKARKTTDRVYGSVNLTLGGASSRTSNARFGLFPGDNTVTSRILDAKAADVLSVTVTLKGKKKSRQIAVGSLRPC